MAVEHVPNTVMTRFRGTTARGPFPVKVPTPSIGGRTLLVQLGGVFFDKTLAEGPSAAPVRFCLWHTVRIDSSCAQCKYLLVAPTVNSVPPTVVPPASRVPPSRHCTLQFLFLFLCKTSHTIQTIRYQTQIRSVFLES